MYINVYLNAAAAGVSALFPTNLCLCATGDVTWPLPLPLPFHTRSTHLPFKAALTIPPDIFHSSGLERKTNRNVIFFFFIKAVRARECVSGDVIVFAVRTLKIIFWGFFVCKKSAGGKTVVLKM